MTDEYGDPEIDLEAEMADAVLRDLLGDVPESADDPDRAALIEVAIATAWPDGTPPTVEDLAHDPDFDAVMGIADVTDVSDDDAPDIGDPDVYDAPDEDADQWADDAAWDVPDASDDHG